MSDSTGAAESHKITLRSRLLTQRQSSPLVSPSLLQDQILSLVRRAAPATIAAYVPVGSEPGGADLPDVLASHARVLLPVLLPDGDLDWAAFSGTLVSGPRGLREPEGPRLGPAAVRSADLVLVPALAVDRRGMRLGRGGGSYDRALGRVPVGTFTCTLLYEGEWPVDVPLDPHDRPVTAVVTPRGISPCRRPPRA